MDVLHVSAECYPAAKVGGLADVVGALPNYLPEQGFTASVVIPKYRTNWLNRREYVQVHQGVIKLHNAIIPFSVEKERSDELGYTLFVVDIPGLFDREGVYGPAGGGGYADEVERSLSFQLAVLTWLKDGPSQPRVLHCHDHHTGLIPFFVRHGLEFEHLRDIPTIFTIHNGEYHGNFGYDKMYLLPPFHWENRGLLDWNDSINPMAAAIKTAWRMTTVSQTYLEELRSQANGLEALIRHEQHKSVGILNGIDYRVWNPRTDEFIAHNLDDRLMQIYKQINKRVLRQRFRLDLDRPLITFIGRLVGEKGADLLPDLFYRILSEDQPFSIAVLGTGEQWLHERFRELERYFPQRFAAALEYNEALAHQLYAGSDFLLMPSRVEPCGLNQMYAMRYGTVPIVRAVGGLKDTVPDIGEESEKGRGVQFSHFNLDDASLAIYRAATLYENKEQFSSLRRRLVEIDFSWERSAGEYAKIYEEVTSV